MSEVEFKLNKINAKPIRIVPFDIGTCLDNKGMGYFKNYLDSKYESIKLSLRALTVLSKNTLAYKITSEVELYVFMTGVGIFVIKMTISFLKRILNILPFIIARIAK